MNKTINVPDNSEGTRQSQVSISLSPGSIDIEHGRYIADKKYLFTTTTTTKESKQKLNVT